MAVVTTARLGLVLAGSVLLAGCGLVPPPADRVAGDGSTARTAAKRAPRTVPAAAQPARVVRIVDGDTLHLTARQPGRVLPAGEVDVRLLEIDTPESVRPDTPVECYAERASARLAELAAPGSTVWVLPDRDLRDPYGRLLLYLWNGRGVFVNLAMVRGGYAKAVLYQPNDRYIDVMRRAEQEARTADRGLWGACAYFGQPAR